MTAILSLISILLITSTVIADVEIYRVIPDKIIYRLNERGKVDITVANKSKKPEKCLLKASMVTDINKRRVIGEKGIELSPDSEKTVSFDFNAGSERYGHAILAEVLTDGKVTAKRSEFFNVIDEWWRVAIIGGGRSKDEKLRRELYDYYHIPFEEYKHSWYPGDYMDEICGPFLSYASHSMLYASMPSLFGDHTPDVPEDMDWYSGRGWYLFNTGKIKKSNEKCAKWGFKMSVYSISAMTGPSGFEIARENPEYVARTKTGAFLDAGYASPDPFALSKGITSKCDHWYGIYPDLYNEDVVRFGAEELADGVKFFGWDGVFFDGCGYVVKSWYNSQGEKLPGHLDPPQVSAKNIHLTREILRKAKPDLFVWHNGANPARVDSSGGTFGSGGGKEGKIAMIADDKSGALKEIQAPQIADPRNAGHNWRSLFEVFLGERDDIRQKDWGTKTSDMIISGSLNPEGFAHDMTKGNYEKTRSQWAWCNHTLSLIASSQIHLFGTGGGFRPILQLMTRFSKFYWHEDIEIMKKSYKYFDIDGLREIWWEDAIYTLDTPKHTDYIINIVNSPEQENAVKTINSCPPAADDIQISCLKWNSAEKMEAWAIQPYNYGAKQKEPSVYKLFPKVIENEVTYELPPFKYYTLIIIRKVK